MNRKLVKWIALITVMIILITSFGFVGYSIIFGN